MFDEDQIYRIDHYLGKETVQNIFVFRFANALFEPLWNSRYIDNIQVTVAETVGVEQRAGYFDNAGELRDMVQSHALQMLALVAMEPPNSLGANDIRSEKAKVLRAIKPINQADCTDCVVRGQYGAGKIADKDVPAYRDEPNVPKEFGHRHVCRPQIGNPELALGRGAILRARGKAHAGARHRSQYRL